MERYVRGSQKAVQRKGWDGGASGTTRGDYAAMDSKNRPYPDLAEKKGVGTKRKHGLTPARRVTHNVGGTKKKRHMEHKKGKDQKINWVQKTGKIKNPAGHPKRPREKIRVGQGKGETSRKRKS